MLQCRVKSSTRTSSRIILVMVSFPELSDVWNMRVMNVICYAERFENWVILRAGGNRLKIETPPVGIPPLPTHPMYNGLNDSAFVTSFEWCCQEQKVDLWKAGLTPAVMMTMVPFQFQCVEM